MIRYNDVQDVEKEMCMSNEMFKGTVEWDGRRITVEGPPDFVSAEIGRAHV